MTVKGHVEKGRIVLDEPFELPEGATLEIHFESPAPSKKIVRSIDDFIGIIPSDIDVREEYYRGQMTRGE